MGSPMEITVYGEKDRAFDAMEKAFSEIARLERLLSVYRWGSDLSRINRFAGIGLIRIDPEVLHLLARALDYSAKSGGAFDPTAGPLIRLWGFGPGGAREGVPTDREIHSELQRVGHRKVKIHLPSDEIELLRPGIDLNLGGIGKGYAVDRAVVKLKEAGITRAIVSCGSTLYALGTPPGRTAWNLGIQHPRSREARIGTVSLRDRALATSGDYERFFVFQGRRFSHLIDPRSGHPAEGTASASVVAPTAMEADVLSTAAFILGAASGKEFLTSFPGVEGLIVEEEAEGRLAVHSTPGWEGRGGEKVWSRRRFIAMTVGFLAGLARPRRAQATVVYATEEEALRRMMPEASRFDPEKVHLSDEQLSRAQQLTGTLIRDREYHFWIGRHGEAVAGYAVKLDVVGKERPITFLIGIEPGGAVRGMEVLIYRESEGSEVRHPRFMKQFLNKRKEDPLRLGQDIQPISGATLSSRSAVYAVRKALSIFETVFKKG